MPTIKINSTKQLTEIFKGLPVRDKFRTKLNEVFKLGFTFTIQTTEDFKCIIGNDKKAYKFRLKYGERSFLLSPVSVGTYATSKDRAVDLVCRNPVATGDNYIRGTQENPIKIPIFRYEVENYTSPTWVTLCRIVGKCISKELQKTVKCLKCGGSGKIAAFRHIDNGICYSCMGIGSWVEVKK